MLANQGRIDMEAESYSNVKNNLKFFIKKVNKEHKPMIIMSEDAKDDCILIKNDCYLILPSWNLSMEAGF